MKNSKTKRNEANYEVVTHVLGLLGGDVRKIPTEDIAKRCWEDYPDRFSWAHYRQFPDREVVRSALVDARKAKNGGLVKGRSGKGRGQATAQSGTRGTDGWTLTEAGIEFFKNADADTETDKTVGNKHRNSSLRRIQALKGHKLWELFLEQGDQLVVDRVDLASMLRCRVNAPTSVWTSQFDRLQQDILGLKEREILPFLEVLRHNFETMEERS